MPEDLGEAALVVVEALLPDVIHATDVDDDGAGVKRRGVAGAREI